MSEIIGKPVSPTIFQLIGSAKKQLGPVGKGERNAQQGFSFRGIDTVVNAIAPVFDELGIITVPEVVEHEYDTVTIGAKQTQMGHVNLIVKYHFYGPDGDSVTATVASESMDAGDKCTAKAMSVAYRTALLQVLNLPTTDPDPDADSYERSAPAQTPKATSQRTTAARPKSNLWSVRIAGADSKDELNGIWKDAGAAGDLQKEVVTVEGEKMTVEKLLFKRNDELALKSGV
jgi:cell division septation protein DedD